MSDIDDSENGQRMDFSSRKWLEGLFKDHPELAIAGYNPIRFGKDLPDMRYVFAKDAVVYNKAKRKPARADIVASIDWDKTSRYVEQLMEDHGIEMFSERMDMEAEDHDAPYINYLKRKARNQKIGRPPKYYRIADARESGTDTTTDHQTAYNDLLDLYKSNKAVFDRLGVNLIDKNKQMISGYTLKLINSGTRLKIIKNDSHREDDNSSVANQVSWLYTLEYLIERLTTIRKFSQNTQEPRRWEAKADHSVETGVGSQDIKDDSIIPTIERIQKIIKHIHARLPWIDTLDLRPVQNLTNGPVLSDSYKFGDNLKLISIKGSKEPSGRSKSELLKSINWRLTLEQFIEAIVHYDELLDNIISDDEIDLQNTASEEFKRMAEKLRKIQATLSEIGVKKSRSITDADIDAFISNDYITKNTEGYKGKTVGRRGLTGRGLKGAGTLKGYSYTSKNLRSIQGSGTASDLKYKQLGSKFIRITDLRLDQPRLKLVYPNRTQVGRIIDISKPLAKCFEHLAFESDINQQMYGKLSVNDKQVVHDLLRLCHLDTTFLNPITNPLEQLQGEFDKLRSQVMLGNDNPDNIRELKTLSLDLYNNKLISEEQMRQILSL